MLKRIWNKYDASIVLAAGVLVLLSAIGGVIVYLEASTADEEEVGCTTEVISLSPPNMPGLIVDAVEMLIEAGVVPSQEAAAAAILDAQYIFDPNEEGELEYWIIFEGPMAAEFNFTCPLNTEGFPLDLEFEGVRGL